MRGLAFGACACLLGALTLSFAAAEPPKACRGSDLTQIEGLAAAKSARADDLVNSDGLLWRVDKPGLAPSYLFGTIHSTDESALAKIKCPVYGFYAENDARITASVPKATETMKKLGKVYEPVTYDGAGHGFMRAGEDPSATGANAKARQDAWKRVKEILGKIQG